MTQRNKVDKKNLHSTVNCNTDGTYFHAQLGLPNKDYAIQECWVLGVSATNIHGCKKYTFQVNLIIQCPVLLGRSPEVKEF